MNPIFTIITVALLSVSSASYAQKSITIECKSTEGHCPKIPTPPKPPTPPAPPEPPEPPEPPSEINLSISVPTAPPMPPAPPKIITPPQAHAACQNKDVGFKITWIIDQTKELSGTCIKENGKMVFDIKTIKDSQIHYK